MQVIPRQLCYNAGLDATDMLNELRARHAGGKECWTGVNVLAETLEDNMQGCVWEPKLVKKVHVYCNVLLYILNI